MSLTALVLSLMLAKMPEVATDEALQALQTQEGAADSSVRRRLVKRPEPVVKQYVVPEVKEGEVLRFQNHGEPTYLQVCLAKDDCETTLLGTNGTAEFTSTYTEDRIAIVSAQHSNLEGRATRFDAIPISEFGKKAVLAWEIPEVPGPNPTNLPYAYVPEDALISGEVLKGSGFLLDEQTWNVKAHFPELAYFDAPSGWSNPMFVEVEGGMAFSSHHHSSNKIYSESWVIGATNEDAKTAWVIRVEDKPPLTGQRPEYRLGFHETDGSETKTAIGIVHGTAIAEDDFMTKRNMHGTGVFYMENNPVASNNTYELWMRIHKEDGSSMPLPVHTKDDTANPEQALWFSFLKPTDDLHIANFDNEHPTNAIITGYRNGQLTTTMTVPMNANYNTRLEDIATQLGGADQVQVQANGHVGAVLFSTEGNKVGYVKR